MLFLSIIVSRIASTWRGQPGRNPFQPRHFSCGRAAVITSILAAGTQPFRQDRITGAHETPRESNIRRSNVESCCSTFSLGYARRDKIPGIHQSSFFESCKIVTAVFRCHAATAEGKTAVSVFFANFISGYSGSR